MSTTTTTTTATTQIRKPKPPASVATVLQDYELCHSGSADAPSPIPVVRTVDENPPGWDISHRRVPPYRPINRNRDPAETNVYQNGVERAFITTMFAGLFVNATAAKVWRAAFEPLGVDWVFRYAVGGEI